MLRTGDIFENPRTGASFEVMHAPAGGDGRLEIRRVIKPHTGKALAHVHMDYVERFVVDSGWATAKLDGSEVALGPGDEVEVRIEQPHVNAYNAGDEDLVIVHGFEPASDFALGYFET